MNNILIIKLGAFGDILSNAGAIQDIREHYSKAKVYILTTPAYRKIMEKCPWVDHVITTERKPLWRIDIILKLKRDVLKLNIDLVIDLQCSNRTNLYYQYLFNHLKWCGLANNSSHQIEKHPFIYNDQTQIERILSRCEIPIKYTMNPSVSWITAPVERILYKNNLIDSKIAVLFFSCAGDNTAKRWPYFNELANNLLKMNITPVYLPGPNEIAAATALPGRTILREDKSCLSFFEVAGICQHANFVIGNDTGPTHMAAFLGVPGLALFGNHPSNMTHFLENSHFDYIKKDNIKNITLANVIDYIKAHFL